MQNYELQQNRAFDLLISNCIKQMKSDGVTDKDINSLIKDAILGVVNTVQDYEQFPNHVYSIIKESAKKKTISHERSVGMMCELLDQIEDALNDKVSILLRLNKIESDPENKSQNRYGSDIEDASELILELLKNGKIDTDDAEVKH